MREKITGLTKKEVNLRKKRGEVNYAIESPSKTAKEIIYSNVFTYFNCVFIVISILLISVGLFRDLSFLPIIIANTLIGIVQELRSKAILDQLQMLNAPTANVLRDGIEKKINAENLVKDDVVVFRAGNQIPADSIVISGHVTVNESLLTGEADEIHKSKNDELLSGSFIVSGECYARLTKVGAESYISKLTIEAKQSKNDEQSEIIKSLNKIVKIVGIIIVPMGAIYFCQQFFLQHSGIQVSVQSMVASIMGMIPEGLFLLANISLAISATRLAAQEVLLHDMRSIETLARVNILCVDKTGTITDNSMEVSDFIVLQKKMDKDEVYTLLSDFAIAQSPDNATMEAMKAYFTEGADRRVSSVSAFSSELKYSGVKFADGDYVLGAPDFILGGAYNDYAETIESYNHKGYRVLAFCKMKNLKIGEKINSEITPIALVLIINSIRESAPKTFAYFAKQGVKIKVISGDTPLTVSEIARKANIADSDKYVDASTLTDDEKLQKAALKYTVFGRVTPEQKRKLIQAMKAAGNTVAMTGDGVNDVLALKDANCSIAMASGSDAAAQAAQVVLLDSDFSKMPSIVAEGRRVVNNLERSGSLFLVKNTFTLLTSIIAIAVAITYPLKPTQLSLISMFTIGIPAFLLSQTPNHSMIRGNFVRNIFMRAIPGGLTNLIIVLLMIVIGKFIGLSADEISTTTTIILCVVGFLTIYYISKPLNWYSMSVISMSVLGLALTATVIPMIFDIATLSASGNLLCMIMLVLCIPAYRIATKITRELFMLADEKDFFSYLSKRWEALTSKSK